MARRWVGAGWAVVGTYRTSSSELEEVRKLGVRLVCCDLADKHSVGTASEELRDACFAWDVLASCPGTLEPIGAFAETSFNEWEQSFQANLFGQLRIIHALLPSRRTGQTPDSCVLLFAGGGTNSAPVNFSAYTISKVALIKFCELLHAELSDTKAVIVGPGWVKTKIHEATLRAGQRAGPNYERTVERLAGSRFTSMEAVLDCCDWIVASPREVVGGRNFSVASDAWGTSELAQKLIADPDMYTLRRRGNEWVSNRSK